MAEIRDAAHEVRLRPVQDQDLGVFFDHQADPEAIEMAAFPARDKDQFAAHRAKVRADDTVVLRTIVADGTVAGNIASWEQDGQRLLGYWVGREHWGRGVATQALAQFVREVTARPLHAHVAVHNAGSIRVLEKCAFRRDRVQEATAQPHLAVQARIELTRAYLALDDMAGARTVMREIEEVLRRRPDLGTLVGETQALRTRLATERRSSGHEASSLTTAELRLLPMLATHMSGPEIAAELFLSPHTVKSQQLSIYRKLGAASRSQAIARARALGLLEG
jgi:RimJ/RimL family protein N-acetyltransferase/DNA-binding CsgD family transcriptional regulator